MTKNYRYQYYVEGQCEQKLISILKEQKTWIISGKIEVFNVVQEIFTNTRLRQLGANTIVILVFDTDVSNTDNLRKNISILKKESNVKAVWCVLQVNNLEDELCRSTNIREIKELIDCKSQKEFKHAFVTEKRLFEKLLKHEFDFDKIWVMQPPNGYDGIHNDGERVKKKRVTNQ